MNKSKKVCIVLLIACIVFVIVAYCINVNKPTLSPGKNLRDVREVLETDAGVYYSYESGIYLEKTTGEVTKLCGDRGYLLQEYDGYLYYRLRGDEYDEIKRCSVTGSKPQTVTTGRDVKDFANDDLYSESIIDFTVFNGTIFIKLQLRISLFSYNIQTGTFDTVLSDVRDWQNADGCIFYTEHASRSFSVFKKDLTTGETIMLAGDNHEKYIYHNFILTPKGMYCSLYDEASIQRIEFLSGIGDGEYIAECEFANCLEFCFDDRSGRLFYVDGRENTGFYLYEIKENNQVCKLAELADCEEMPDNLRVADGKLYYRESGKLSYIEI